SPGSYQIVANPTDGSQSASVGITIQGSPVAQFVMSAGAQSASSGGVLNLGVAQGGTVTVTLDASASTGSITAWSWLNNGSPLPCAGTTCTYAFPVTTQSNSIKLI